MIYNVDFGSSGTGTGSQDVRFHVDYFTWTEVVELPCALD